MRTYPRTAEALKENPIYTGWWYYNIELVPGLVTKGQYEPTFPMLPRMLLRHCALEGMDCLDMGSMEGLIPVLMTRRGARRVLATDAVDHCLDKIAVVQHYYGATFDFRSVGLMYELDKKLPRQSFDLINCSGLLYHVMSPFAVLAGVRALLKRNGLLILTTNVAHTGEYTMEFNNGGRLQEEANTFWYISIPLLDYLLRYLKLAPIDSAYLPHANIASHIRYQADKPTGLLSVVCRAMETPLHTRDDEWMDRSTRESWESQGLVDWRRATQNSFSRIVYDGPPSPQHVRDDTTTLDLWRAAQENRPVEMTLRSADTHTLALADRS